MQFPGPQGYSSITQTAELMIGVDVMTKIIGGLKAGVGADFNYSFFKNHQEVRDHLQNVKRYKDQFDTKTENRIKHFSGTVQVAYDFGEFGVYLGREIAHGFNPRDYAGLRFNLGKGK